MEKSQARSQRFSRRAQSPGTMRRHRHGPPCFTRIAQGHCDLRSRWPLRHRCSITTIVGSKRAILSERTSWPKSGRHFETIATGFPATPLVGCRASLSTLVISWISLLMGGCSIQTILQGVGRHSLPREAWRPTVICSGKRGGRIITDEGSPGEADRYYRQALERSVSGMDYRDTSSKFIVLRSASVSSSGVHCWAKIFSGEQRIAKATVT